MELFNKFIFFIYYLSVIFLTLILSFVIFGIVINRLVLTSPDTKAKTKYYYLELFSVWVVLFVIFIYIKHNFNNYSKKTITIYMEKNDTDYMDFADLKNQIEKLEKFDVIICLGFLIVLFNSQHHTIKEKFKLLNEDIGFLTDIFIL